jgi:hypothetical protein
MSAASFPAEGGGTVYFFSTALVVLMLLALGSWEVGDA